MGLGEFIRDPKNRPLVIGGGIAIAGLIWAGYVATTRVREGRCPLTGKPGKNHCATTGATSGGKCQFSHGSQALGKHSVAEYKEKNLERYMEIKKSVLEDQKSDQLSYSSLTGIQKLAVEVTSLDLREVLEVNRKKRRAQLNNPAEYSKIAVQGLKDVDELFNRNLNDLLKDFHVSNEKYRSSMQQHFALNPLVGLEGTHLRKVLVSSLNSINEPVYPTVAYTANIHRFMADLYSTIPEPADPLYRAQVKEMYLFDKVHEKYAIEEEDILALRKRYPHELVKEQVDRLEDEILKGLQKK